MPFVLHMPIDGGAVEQFPTKGPAPITEVKVLQRQLIDLRLKASDLNAKLSSLRDAKNSAKESERPAYNAPIAELQMQYDGMEREAQSLIGRIAALDVQEVPVVPAMPAEILVPAARAGLWPAGVPERLHRNLPADAAALARHGAPGLAAERSPPAGSRGPGMARSPAAHGGGHRFHRHRGGAQRRSAAVHGQAAHRAASRARCRSHSGGRTTAGTRDDHAALARMRKCDLAHLSREP